MLSMVAIALWFPIATSPQAKFVSIERNFIVASPKPDNTCTDCLYAYKKNHLKQ